MRKSLAKTVNTAFGQAGLANEIGKFDAFAALGNAIKNLRCPDHSRNQFQGTFFIEYGFVHMPSLTNRLAN
jgi:hypothetical protein